MGPEIETRVRQPDQVNESQIDRCPEHDQDLAMRNVKSIVLDAVLDVAALIDAVCCRIGDWVDRDRCRLHPDVSKVIREDPGPIVRLALAKGEHALPDGGYIEVRILPQEELVEADGGYYDEHNQPQRVIQVSLRWNEVNHKSLGQALLLIYDRIIRAYIVGEIPGDRSCLRQPTGPVHLVEEGIRR